MIRRFIDVNISLSKAFDALLPARFRVDGNRDFLTKFAPRWIRPGIEVVDVGGGKNPYLSAGTKADLGIRVIGVDISEAELVKAPPGTYDEIACADITRYRGQGSADVCICQAVLEHVRDTSAAFAAISSTLKPGGIALIFVPSRNAAFARLNLLLPQRLKQRLLYGIFPNAQRNQGFQSFYDRCTPRDFERMASDVGLSVVDSRYYFTSSYFSFFVPLYVVWRFWVLGFHLIAGRQAAETFSYAFEKREVAHWATGSQCLPTRSAA